MRVYVFGGLGLALATSISMAPDALAFGDYDDEVSLSEFFQDRASYTSTDLREERSNLLEALKEARKPADRAERDQMKEQLELLKLEKDFAETMVRNVRPRLGSRTEWSKIAEADSAGIQKAIEDALEAKKMAGAGADVTLNSRQIGEGHQVNGYPFKVINSVDFEKEKDGKFKAKVTQKLVLDESIPRSEWSSSFRRKFEEMSDADMQKFLDDHVNEELEEAGFEVAKIDDFENEESKKKIMEDLPIRLANDVVSDSFGTSQSSAFRSGISERIEELGTASDLSSEIGSLTEEYNMLSDAGIRRERLEGLEAKYRVASALSSNASLRKKFENGEIEACEEIIKILGGEANFKKLSDSAKMGCDSYLEKEEVAEEVAETQEEIEEEVAANDRQQTQAAQNKFMDLVQHCKARRQALANGALAGPFDALIGPMYRGLLANGAGCTYFGTFMGKIDSTGAGDDMAMASMFGAEFAQMFQDDPANSAFATKAKEHVNEMAIPSYEGTETLEEQAQCLSKMASLGNMSLQSVAGTVPGGMMNPQLAQDPKIQQMKKFADAAGALHKAVKDELTVRKTAGVGGLTAMDSRSGAGRSPAGAAASQKSLSSIGGTAVPVRTLNTAASWAERGQSGTTLNQGLPNVGGSQNRGITPLPANAPPPMFNDNQ